MQLIESAFSKVLNVLHQITNFLRMKKYTLLGLIRLCDINRDSVLERKEVEHSLTKNGLPVTGNVVISECFKLSFTFVSKIYNYCEYANE